MVPRPERNKSLKPWPTLWPPSRMRRRRERPGTRDDARLVGRRPEDDPRRRYTANLRGEVDTAALFKKPAQALEDAIDHGRYAAITARGFTEMQGELPVVVDGEVIGAIGESFATPEEDEEVAKQVLAALNRDRNLSIFSTPLR
jgi:hypothetical protein